jgi:heme/copper-type cytochrome/quinol oxidase subunit 4
MKIVNVVLAIGTAVILGALITLGIKAFYPEPIAPTYPSYPAAAAPCAIGDTKCMTQQQSQSQHQQDQFNEQEQVYQDQMNVYNENVFIAANIIGIIVFVIGFMIVLYGSLADQGAPIGIMLAGLWSILYGYGRGWGSIDDRLKFIVGLVVAVLVVGGSMWLLQHHRKKHT